MKLLSTRFALHALGLLALVCTPQAVRAGDRCEQAGILAVEGRPGWHPIRTPAGGATALWPDADPASLTPAFVIRALENGWDADGLAETVTDTLVVPAGSTVRWQLVSGIHTLTNGRDPSDPDAGSRFDYLLDELHPRFDSTFTSPDTIEYFCFFHEPRMRGVLIVSASASVPGDRLPTRISFTRPPRPNPTRGTVSFDVGMPREMKVRLEVLDLLGGRVALLHDGPLAAGEHPFRWRGVTDRGERARPGVYLVLLRSGVVTVTRPVSLLR